MSETAAEASPGIQTYMKPRSLILDLFGDYLRYNDNEVKVGDLVELLGVFGIEPATVRVTLSRLRREHWFTTRRLGRETVYSLSEHMIGILDEGRARIFADYDQPWDGRWTTVVQHTDKPDRLTRDQLRRRLFWMGFGPLSASTWLTPHDRTADVDALSAEFEGVSFTVLQSRGRDTPSDLALARRCWDLDGINDQYAEFIAEDSALLPTMEALAGPDALIARTAVIARYRHFPFMDPWLPPELRPPGWLGGQANLLFRQAHRGLALAANEYVASVVGQRLHAPEQ